MNTLTDDIYSGSVLSESGALFLWAEEDSGVLSALVPVPFRVFLRTLASDPVMAVPQFLTSNVTHAPTCMCCRVGPLIFSDINSICLAQGLGVTKR